MSTSKRNTKSSTPPAAEPFTLPWTLDKYTDYLRTTRGLSRGFIASSRHALRRFFTFLSEQGVADIRQVTRKHVDAFQEALLESPLKTVTKRGLLFCLVSFFRYLFEFGYANEELHLVVEPPPKPHQIPRTILSQEEVRFLASLPNPQDLYEFQDLCLLTLLFASGMRPEESCGLTLEDVGLKDLKRQSPQVIVRRPKNKMDRVVSIDPYTASLLERFIGTARPWMTKGKPTHRLFLTALGTPMTRDVFERRFYTRYAPAFKEKFGKEITLYSLRHSSATHWLDEGFRHDQDILPCVQRQLGHKRMDSTAVYTHVAIEPMREMLRRYHPRELAYASLGKIPESPKDLPPQT